MAAPTRSPDQPSSGQCRALVRNHGKRALNDRDGGGQGSWIWLNLLRLALGQIDRLSLDSSGAGAGFEVRATGILKSYYGHALVSLA
jgi:hypothetical protein